MFFVSTPSLIISLVLAFFYLANLAFFAVNRQQDTGNAVEIVAVGLENEWCLQQAFLVHSEENPLKHKAKSDSKIGDIHIRDFCVAISKHDTFRQFLPDLSFPLFHPELCWKLFSRPPPTC